MTFRQKISALERRIKHLQKKEAVAVEKMKLLSAALAHEEKMVAHYRHRLHIEMSARK